MEVVNLTKVTCKIHVQHSSSLTLYHHFVKCEWGYGDVNGDMGIFSDWQSLNCTIDKNGKHRELQEPLLYFLLLNECHFFSLVISKLSKVCKNGIGSLGRLAKWVCAINSNCQQTTCKSQVWQSSMLANCPGVQSCGMQISIRANYKGCILKIMHFRRLQSSVRANFHSCNLVVAKFWCAICWRAIYQESII